MALVLTFVCLHNKICVLARFRYICLNVRVTKKRAVGCSLAEAYRRCVIDSKIKARQLLLGG